MSKSPFLNSYITLISIEEFAIKQKVKELIVYKDNLLRIAFQLNYRSVACLSSLLKQETHITPSLFNKMGKRDRNTFDSMQQNIINENPNCITNKHAPVFIFVSYITKYGRKHCIRSQFEYHKGPL